MTTRTRYRRAMTAIEVLVATMLASLMLGSVVGLLGALSRQQKALRTTDVSPPWHQQFIEQFSWDLTNSRQFAASSEGVRLAGFAGRHFSTGRATGRPTDVEYYMIEAAGDRWLMRRETHRDERSNVSSRTEAVCRGVGRLQFGSAVIDQGVTVRGPKLAVSQELTPLPDRVVVQLYRADGATHFFNQTFLVR